MFHACPAVVEFLCFECLMMWNLVFLDMFSLVLKAAPPAVRVLRWNKKNGTLFADNRALILWIYLVFFMVFMNVKCPLVESPRLPRWMSACLVDLPVWCFSWANQDFLTPVAYRRKPSGCPLLFAHGLFVRLVSDLGVSYSFVRNAISRTSLPALGKEHQRPVRNGLSPRPGRVF